MADGLLHAATSVFVAVGSSPAVRTWQQGRLAPPWRYHVGLLLIGWGGFNVVEGVVDHHALRDLRVRDDSGNPLPWDLAFLTLGLALILGGLALCRARRPGMSAAWRGSG